MLVVKFLSSIVPKSSRPTGWKSSSKPSLSLNILTLILFGSGNKLTLNAVVVGVTLIKVMRLENPEDDTVVLKFPRGL